MIPARYANALYFTPRTPWGTRVLRRNPQSHMTASGEGGQQPVPILKKTPPTVGQTGPTQLAERAAAERMMDRNNVPRSLQGQISPERAQEVTDSSWQTLSARPLPSLKDTSFLPPPKQSPQAAPGSGVLAPTSQKREQALPSQSEADKILKASKPINELINNPLNFKDFELTPSATPHGFRLQGTKKF